MGAFLLLKDDCLKTRELSSILDQTHDLFYNKLKLPYSGKFKLGEYTLLLYKKRFYEHQNYFNIGNGDFIASTGSLYYRGKFGLIALKLLYQDFIKGIKIENYFRGHFCAIIKKGNEIIIFKDYYGIYPVYVNKANTIISSSFIVSALSEKKLSVARDELYEYIFNGYYYSNQTIFNELTLLPEKQYVNLSINLCTIFSPEIKEFGSTKYEDILEEVSASILDQFGILTSAFENITTGLSGGYDSRLILASLLNLKIEPKLFVNGTPGSVDIVCAKTIANGLDLDIKEVNFYKEFEVPEQSRKEFLMNRFYSYDGLGTGGVFDIYSDLEYKINNPLLNTALLNGAGGEIYRESWNIPDKSLNLDSFVNARYNKYAFDRILVNYSKKKYLLNIVDKSSRSIEKSDKKLKRSDIELLHPARHKAIHFIMSTQQRLHPFIMPFYEPSLIEQSHQIPITYKYRGRFNKDLIDKLYQGLGAYVSSYGYTFNQKIPFKLLLRDYLITNTPLNLRPILRRFRKSKKIPVTQFGIDLLSEEVVRSVLPEGILGMKEFINLGDITDYGLRSRILTLELLFTELNL